MEQIFFIREDGDIMGEKKLYHEDLGLEAIDRLRIIRDTRTDVHGRWTLKLKDSQLTFEVKDYSAFGLKVFSDAENVPDIVSASLFIEGIPMADLQLRKIRHKSRESGFEFGFEILGEPLNIGALKGYAQGTELIQKIKSQVSADLPDNFKKIVYEAKELFESLESSIEQLGSDFGVTQEEISSYQEAFARLIAEHLTVALDKKFNDIALVLKTMNESTAHSAGEFFRKTLSRFLHLSPFADRSIKKPLGYAGDFDMMRLLYNNEPLGDTLFSKCLHYYFMQHPNAQAVRNRKVYIYSKIKQSLTENQKERPIKVLSVACGPAEEVAMLIQNAEEFNQHYVEIDLLDQDVRALQYAQRNLKTAKRRTLNEIKVNYINKGIKNVIQGGLDIKYHLIYSAGLFDYFSDAIAQFAARQLYQALLPGGRLIIGNFKENAPHKALMDLVLDWHLIYRDEEKLKQLYGSLGGQVTIESEANTINLFANIQKPLK